MKQSLNYKTQRGLLAALHKAADKDMDCALAVWLQNVKWTLINQFGWEEVQASRYVAAYAPQTTKYIAG